MPSIKQQLFFVVRFHTSIIYIITWKHNHSGRLAAVMMIAMVAVVIYIIVLVVVMLNVVIDDDVVWWIADDRGTELSKYVSSDCNQAGTAFFVDDGLALLYPP